MSGQPAHFTGSDAGQLACILASANCGGTSPTTFAFDKDGNRTCKGTGTNCATQAIGYAYDGADRLKEWCDTSPCASGAEEQMTYNGDGLLTQTQYSYLNGGGGCPFIPGHAHRAHVAGGRGHARRGITNRCYWTDYLTWNTALGGVPTLASDDTWDPGGNEGPEDYIMGPQGLPIEQLYDGDSQPMWYYDDFSGDTRALVDATDTIETQNYPLFGTVTNHWSGSGIDTPLQFAGMYNDGWTNLEYDQARFYDPSTGQFLSTDPLAQQTLQPFAYAGSDPVNASDPTGQHACYTPLPGFRRVCTTYSGATNATAPCKSVCDKADYTVRCRDQRTHKNLCSSDGPVTLSIGAGAVYDQVGVGFAFAQCSGLPSEYRALGGAVWAKEYFNKRIPKSGCYAFGTDPVYDSLAPAPFHPHQFGHVGLVIQPIVAVCVKDGYPKCQTEDFFTSNGPLLWLAVGNRGHWSRGSGDFTLSLFAELTRPGETPIPTEPAEHCCDEGDVTWMDDFYEYYTGQDAW